MSFECRELVTAVVSGNASQYHYPIGTCTKVTYTPFLTDRAAIAPLDELRSQLRSTKSK